MPCEGAPYYGGNITARKLAEKQVREKFPTLRAGTPGWYRAVENRYKRIR